MTEVLSHSHFHIKEDNSGSVCTLAAIGVNQRATTLYLSETQVCSR